MRKKLEDLKQQITAVENALAEQSTVEDTISLIGSCAPYLTLTSPCGTVLINTPEARACAVEALEYCLSEITARVNRLEKELDNAR